MNEFTNQLQLVFTIAAVMPFIIGRDVFKNLPSAIDPATNTISLPRALVIFTVASVIQLFVVWLGNMSDQPYVWFFAHLAGGVIFGAGLRLATLSVNRQEH